MQTVLARRSCSRATEAAPVLGKSEFAKVLSVNEFTFG
jgi:hypothetical protein